VLVSKRNAIRIIAGEHRGRRLVVPDLPGLRPTGNRQRETLFNWLQATIAGARCLDVFAGSGALSLEALSRGAERTLCLERDPAACAALRRVLAEWGLTARAAVKQVDALGFLCRHVPEPFDLVFVDPPFQDDAWQRSIDALAGGWIRAGSLIYLEYPSPGAPVRLPPGWSEVKSRTTGRIGMSLLQVAAA